MPSGRRRWLVTDVGHGRLPGGEGSPAATTLPAPPDDIGDGADDQERQETAAQTKEADASAPTTTSPPCGEHGQGSLAADQGELGTCEVLEPEAGQSAEDEDLVDRGKEGEIRRSHAPDHALRR